MPILLVLFIFLFAIVIGESVMLGRWNAAAFRSGIVIFKRKIEEKQVSDIDLQELESEFGKSLAPSIIFHRHNFNEIFFREKMLSFKLFSYTPIMHGQIRPNRIGSILIGRLSWSSVGFVLVWYSFILAVAWGEFTEKNVGSNLEISVIFLGAFFIGIPILVYGLIYATQSYRFKKIAKSINK